MRRTLPPSAEIQTEIDKLLGKGTFNELNGHTLTADDPELAAWIISFSSGTTPEEIADRIRPRIEPID